MSTDTSGRRTETGIKAIKITPSSVALALGEPQLFRLTDDRGRPVQDAQWKVSEPGQVELQPTGGDLRLTAYAPGKLILTATWGELAARAQVRVFESGGFIPHEADSPAVGVVITPSTLSLVMGEPGWLRLNDERGRPIRDALWMVDQPVLVELKPGPDATVIGKSPGQVKVTASWQGQSAEAEVNILPGQQLPNGSIPWSIKPIPGYSTMAFVQAQPSLLDGPNLFVTEVDASGHSITRALMIDGREMWRTPMDLRHEPVVPNGSNSSSPAAGRTPLGGRGPRRSMPQRTKPITLTQPSSTD